jgi:superfamily II DNA/RNA helicase
MSHVFNFDVPIHAEDYVHRIGRTGRAGRQGHAFTIATPEDRKYLDAIQEITGQEIPLLKLDGVGGGKLEDAGEFTEPRKQNRASKSGERGGKGRSRGRGRDRKRPDKTAQTEAKPEVEPKPETKPETEKAVVEQPKIAEKANKQPTPPAPKDSSGEEKGGSWNKTNDPVKGLGNHVPAFLMAAAPKKKS